MSVPDQTPYIIHTANGITTVFAFEFYIIAVSDLRVAANGTDVTSGFTVSGTGNTRGGEVTFSAPPVSGSKILIERQISALRLTEYQNNGDLLAETVNKDFDRLWMSNKRSEIYLDLALQRPLTGGEFDANGFQIKNLEKPIDAGDAATKGYSDELYVEFTGKADQLNDAFANGMYGFILIDSFQKGVTLTFRNHALRDEITGEFYRWDGDWSVSKKVPAGSSPGTTGGIAKGAWVSVGDASLRVDIKNGDGSLIGSSHRQNIKNDLDALDRHPSGHGGDFKATLENGKTINLERTYDRADPIELASGERLLGSGGGVNVTSSKVSGIGIETPVSDIAINGFEGVGSTTIKDQSKEAVDSYLINIRDSVLVAIRDAKASQFTGGVALIRCMNSFVDGLHTSGLM